MSAPASHPAHKFKTRVLGALLTAYQSVLSPLLHAGYGSACRFQPTCSEYAILAVHQYGIAHGGWLALRRLLRCHPGCAGGFDPVPEAPAATFSDPDSPSPVKSPPSASSTESGTLHPRHLP